MLQIQLIEIPKIFFRQDLDFKKLAHSLSRKMEDHGFFFVVGGRVEARHQINVTLTPIIDPNYFVL